MLDTNICIAVMKGRPAVQSKISNIDPAEIGISSIVLAELAYGVWKSSQKERNTQALTDFCSICSVWDWPAAAADTYGEIRGLLEQQGRIIGANDLLIAAHTKYLNAVLITNNTREFNRIPGLPIEDWTL
ncbi:type II toxin-antitoxin system tRNA(fMet)-specific endonuclease VapC [Desulfovermiculus halophilus]|uniref:type II toxin-antitoxin system tRNA(fMet)-specific endonuclease VapC n=1 Tax=Desulfovermiculus halophilus TaxID=339722 RepID=UPI001ABF425D|nr:type II toxin-antitoxin system VapC family toxin [Desulfovermiculus halophilus]